MIGQFTCRDGHGLGLDKVDPTEDPTTQHPKQHTLTKHSDSRSRRYLPIASPSGYSPSLPPPCPPSFSHSIRQDLHVTVGSTRMIFDACGERWKRRRQAQRRTETALLSVRETGEHTKDRRGRGESPVTEDIWGTRFSR